MLDQISGWLVILKEGSQIDSLTTCYGFRPSSCIHLIFTDQPSLIIDSGTHPSLRPNCHHKIIHSKIDLKITSMRF